MGKRIFAVFLSLIMVVGLTPAMAFAETEPAEDYGKPGKDYVEGQAIVCLKGTTSTAKLAKQKGMGDFEFEMLMKADGISGGEANAAGAKAAAADGSTVLALVNSEEKTADLIKKLEQNPQVEYAEPNYTVEFDGMEPADPGYPYQWYLKNPLKTDSPAAQVPAADTNISKAWEKADASGKSEKTVIAVLDSGVDYNHPDLKDIMWDDGLKIPALTAMGGGKYGYNSCPDENSDNPMDVEVGHGTHCAGIIASQWNDQGTAGVGGDNVEIMAVRFAGMKQDDSLTGPTIADAVKGYAYIQAAAENGVNIAAVNNSWGASTPNCQVANSIMTATDIVGQKYGIISCFGAGNEAADTDLNTASGRTGDYVINVGAMDSSGAGADFSNYGKRTVDVVAPGTAMLSTTTSDKTLPQQDVMLKNQYLPQIMDKEQTWFYEDFEDKEDKVELHLFNKDKELVESAKAVSGSAASGRCLQLSLDAIEKGELYLLQVIIPKSELEGIGTEDPVYMALQGRWDNTAYGDLFLIGYIDDENGVNMLNDGNQFCNLSVRDHGWNQFSSFINNTEFMQSDRDEIRLLLWPYSGKLTGSEGAEGKPPVFYLDNIGFGKSATPYCYSSGTSMAAPVVTGLAGLLAAGTDLTPEEIVARIKGGVNRQDAIGLKDKSISDGFIDAAAAFDETKCVPVLNKLNVSGNTAALSGYFFGDNEGTLVVDGKAISSTKWTDREITFNLPEDMTGMQEVRVVRTGMDTQKDYGKNFFKIKQENLGFRSLTAPKLSYGEAEGSGYPLTSADFLSGDLAATDGKIARLAYNWDNLAWAMEIYDIASDSWEKAPAVDILIPKMPEESVNTHSMTAGGKKLYLSYVNNDGKTCFAIYDLSKKSWKKVAGHDLKGGESLAVYQDKLLAIGGETTDAIGQINPVSTVKILDPNTGKVIGKLPDMPQARRGVKAFTSGEQLYICGSYDIYSEDLLEGEEGKYDNIMAYDGKKWTVSEEPFLSDAFTGFDQGQTLHYGFGAADNGLFAVGPVKNLDSKDMRDTWFYDAEKNTWSAREDVRYYETKTTNNKGVCYNGSFYVLSAARRASEPLVFRELPGVSYTGPKDQLITQPAAPKIKAESSLTSTKLSWSKVSGATGYEIYRASSKNGTYKKVFTTAKQSWANTGLSTGKTNYYKVRAYKKSGNATIYGKYSGWLAATPKPAVPTFKLSALDNGAKVSWNKVSGASGYKIYRATSKNGTYKLIKTAKSTDRSYTNKNLKNKKAYYYKVRSYKVVNGKNVYSKYSIVKSIKTK